MRNKILALAAIVALASSPSLPALAKGQGGGSHMGHFARPPGFSHGAKVGWGHRHVPPGWSHGQKTGWGKGHVPPGLARR